MRHRVGGPALRTHDRLPAKAQLVPLAPHTQCAARSQRKPAPSECGKSSGCLFASPLRTHRRRDVQPRDLGCDGFSCPPFRRHDPGVSGAAHRRGARLRTQGPEDRCRALQWRFAALGCDVRPAGRSRMEGRPYRRHLLTRRALRRHGHDTLQAGIFAAETVASIWSTRASANPSRPARRSR